MRAVGVVLADRVAAGVVQEGVGANGGAGRQVDGSELGGVVERLLANARDMLGPSDYREAAGGLEGVVRNGGGIRRPCKRGQAGGSERPLVDTRDVLDPSDRREATGRVEGPGRNGGGIWRPWTVPMAKAASTKEDTSIFFARSHDGEHPHDTQHRVSPPK